MYRLKINRTESYMYDTKTKDFELHLNGDIINVSSFSPEKRAQRFVSLAGIHFNSHGSRQAVTRAMMILIAKDFDSKRQGDRLVDKVTAEEATLRNRAKVIIAEVFWRKAQVPSTLPHLSQGAKEGRQSFPGSAKNVKTQGIGRTQLRQVPIRRGQDKIRYPCRLIPRL
jgi:hypothetical protein